MLPPLLNRLKMRTAHPSAGGTRLPRLFIICPCVFAVAEFAVRLAAVAVRPGVFRDKPDEFAVILHRAPVVAETVVRYGPVEVGVGVPRVNP